MIDEYSVFEVREKDGAVTLHNPEEFPTCGMSLWEAEEYVRCANGGTQFAIIRVQYGREGTPR